MDEVNLLSFILTQIPDEWEYVPEYTTRFVSFTLNKHSREYKMVESYFHGARITQIQRIQNPFQFGRYVFRREMLKTNYEGVVFHGVHHEDLDTALKFNCDYRRYRRKHEFLYEDGQHPKFYYSFSDLIKSMKYRLSDLVVLFVKILTNEPQSQCDYFIQYTVKF